MSTETIVETTCDVCGRKNQLEGLEEGIPFNWVLVDVCVCDPEDPRWREFPEQWEICPECWGKLKGVLHEHDKED